MLADYRTQLEREIAIFRTAKTLELEKRNYILQAYGTQLMELTCQTETLLGELDEAEGKRKKIEKDFLETSNTEISHDELTLTKMVDLSLREDEQLGRELEALSKEFREAAMQLKKETEENNRLLASSNASIQRLMGELRELAAPETNKTYNPGGKNQPNRKSSGSVLLSTNA